MLVAPPQQLMDVVGELTSSSRTYLASRRIGTPVNRDFDERITHGPKIEDG